MIKKSLRAYITCCQLVLGILSYSKVIRILFCQFIKHHIHRILEEVYISMINKAEKYCWFMTPYLITADKLLCVRGNCDADVDQMVLQFPILAEYCFLALEGVTICAAHGHRIGPDDPPPLQPGDYLLCGHIHIPVRRNCGTYTYLNPGSVALPKENTPHSFMTLENGVFTWHDLVSRTAFQPLD